MLTTPRTTARLATTAVLALLLVVAATSAVLAGSRRANPTFEPYGPINAIQTWAHGFDGDDTDMFMSAFTDDPTFLFYLSAGADPFVFEGREAVEGLFVGAIEAQVPGETRRHVTTNHLVEQVDRNTALVTSYLTLLQSIDGVSEDPAVIASGVYTDTIVRGADGSWRIDRRELVLDTPTADDDDASDALLP